MKRKYLKEGRNELPVTQASPDDIDTQALGGIGGSSFEVTTLGKEISGFNRFEKVGTSTWTLTGSSTELTPWDVSEGTLAVSDGELVNQVVYLEWHCVKRVFGWTADLSRPRYPIKTAKISKFSIH